MSGNQLIAKKEPHLMEQDLLQTYYKDEGIAVNVGEICYPPSVWAHILLSVFFGWLASLTGINLLQKAGVLDLHTIFLVLSISFTSCFLIALVLYFKQLQSFYSYINKVNNYLFNLYLS